MSVHLLWNALCNQLWKNNFFWWLHFSSKLFKMLAEVFYYALICKLSLSHDFFNSLKITERCNHWSSSTTTLMATILLSHKVIWHTSFFTLMVIIVINWLIFTEFTILISLIIFSHRILKSVNYRVCHPAKTRLSSRWLL
jgi:hypothetical protein